MNPLTLYNTSRIAVVCIIYQIRCAFERCIDVASSYHPMVTVEECMVATSHVTGPFQLAYSPMLSRQFRCQCPRLGTRFSHVSYLTLMFRHFWRSIAQPDSNVGVIFWWRLRPYTRVQCLPRGLTQCILFQHL